SDEEQSPINHKQGLYVGSITALAGMLLILAGVVLAGSSQSIFVAIGCIVLLFSLFLLQPTLHSKRAWQKQKTK
ncbi:transporter, partial [Vibrio sp. 1249-1]|nr:transporter [Vibrio sp. 1249-1]